MIDNSARYGLYNPVFSQDIGTNMLSHITGNSIKDLDDFKLSGGAYTMDGINFPNALTIDKFESSKAKKKANIKKGIFIGLVIVAAILLGKFTGLGKKLKDYIKKIPGAKEFYTKVKDKFSTLKSKIKKPDFSALKSKIKMPDFKALGDKIKNLFKFKK